MGTESTTWARARDGDPDAFGDVFDTHRDRVFGQALRLTRSAHDAEDVTALVFLEAWRRRADVRVVDGSIIAWLLVATNYVANNTARSLRRHRAAMASLPQPEPGHDFSNEVNERLDAEPRAAAARAAFAGLSQRDQDVVTLCIFEQLSTAEAADVLGIPAGTVKSRLSRAKQKLADVLSDFAEPETTIEGAR
jgi:RNA polymerase sigma-70 factor (ECF subfamily)